MASQAVLFPVNIFLGLREQNVTFCLDISGSMYNALDTIKEQLIQYLLEQSVLAKFNLNRLFNLIAFSTEIYPWSNGMVLWNTATVNSAINWLKDLETKTGTNTLDALLTAFQDAQTNSVVLVTDDICDQDPYMLLNQITQIANGRPVHCIYITTSKQADDDRSAIEFLQNLSTVTRGSFKIVQIGRNGVERITPISSFDINTLYQLSNLSLNANQPCLSYSNLNVPSSTTLRLVNHFVYPKYLTEPTVLNYPSFVMHPRVLVTQDGKIPSNSIAWSRFRPVQILKDGTVVGLAAQNTSLPLHKDIAYAPDAGTLLINKHVLARSSLDGHYYKGKVLSQVLAHRFTVQFGPSQNGKFQDSYYQDTAIYDLIHFDDAFMHSIETNDKCLAIVDESSGKYSPCEVLDGFEKRHSSNEEHNEKDNVQIIVRFPNGKTRTVPFDEAIWIPDAVYEKIKFELNLPSTARQYLDEYSTNSIQTSTLHASNIERVIMPRLIYDIWPYYVPYYPLYTNAVFSDSIQKSLNAAATLHFNLSNDSIKLPVGQPIVTTVCQNSQRSAPVYHRQIKCNEAVVDAQSVNQSIIGSLLTPDELNRRVMQQIYEHRNLLNGSRSNSCCSKCSRSRSRSRSQSREAVFHRRTLHNTIDCSPKQNSNTFITMKPSLNGSCTNHLNYVNESHDHQHNINLNKTHYHHYVDHGSANHNSETNHRHLHHNSCHGGHAEEDSRHATNNKYYDSYVQSIKSLYDSVKHADRSTSRSKSVTFYDREHLCNDDDDDVDGNSKISEPEIELEFDEMGRRVLRKSMSSNTDVSFQNKEHNALYKKNKKNKLSSAKSSASLISSNYMPNRRHWRCFH